MIKLKDILNESVNEGVGREAMGIAGFTGTRGIAVQKFIDDFNLNAKKLFNFISKGKLKDRMDFATAISGNPGNKYQGNFVGMFGESKVTEAKSDYEVYHKSYTSAIQAAKAYAEKKGYEINDDDSFRQIGMGPRKPSEGKTNKFSIELSKDGKVQRKKLQIQVYGMRNSYELNAYIQ
jgi:hypothetical protein